MTFTRRNKFGTAPGAFPGSQTTSRMVPLMGVRLDDNYTQIPPGSGISLSNYLPVHNRLIPRSRLSKSFADATPGTYGGYCQTLEASNTPNIIWSGASKHFAQLTLSPGGLSLMSFTSAGGFGTQSNITHLAYQYAQVPINGVNSIIAAGATSHETLIAFTPSQGATNLFSYLSGGAPQAVGVGVFESYAVAVNIKVGNSVFGNRVMWSDRGEASTWVPASGNICGFEDLFAMRGYLTAAKQLDNRLILFGTHEIWVGTATGIPGVSQFFFQPLETQVGCPYAGTISDTEQGIIFLGGDLTVRLLPRGGGLSQVISQDISPALEWLNPQGSSGSYSNPSWGVYDPIHKLEHLFIQPSSGVTTRGFVVNTTTGAWGFMDYQRPPTAGVAITVNRSDRVEAMYWSDSLGTVFSSNSKIATDTGSSAVTSTWRSAPIGSDLAANYKTLTEAAIGYTATSLATLRVKVSQDGGSTYDSGQLATLSPVIAGVAKAQMYAGSAVPTIEVASSSTGYEIHRLDVAFKVGGRA